MIVALLLMAASQFPSATDTTWMEPAAFRLVLGESRDGVRETFETRGWSLEPGESDDVLVHPYDDRKSVAMEFREDRLVSVRFELVSFRPQLAGDWDDLRDQIRERFGEPEVDQPRVQVVNTPAFTIHAVLNDSVDSELGQSGAGMIIVRYFVPASSDDPADTTR